MEYHAPFPVVVESLAAAFLVDDLADQPLAVVAVGDHTAVGVRRTGDISGKVVGIPFFSSVCMLHLLNPSPAVHAVTGPVLISVLYAGDPASAVVAEALYRLSRLTASGCVDLGLLSVDSIGVHDLLSVRFPEERRFSIWQIPVFFLYGSRAVGSGQKAAVSIVAVAVPVLWCAGHGSGAAFRQKFRLQLVIFVIFINKYRAEAVFCMDDTVFQVIIVPGLPGLQPFSLTGDTDDVPGIIVGDRDRSVHAVCTIHSPLPDQAVTGVVFPKYPVSFRCYDLCPVSVLIVAVSGNGILSVSLCRRQTIVQFLPYFCQTARPVIAVVKDPAHLYVEASIGTATTLPNGVSTHITAHPCFVAHCVINFSCPLGPPPVLEIWLTTPISL